MGDTAKRFSSLLTVICRTAKRSANKMVKIRKKKSGGEEINKLSTTSEDVESPCKARSTNKPGTSEEEKGNIIFHSLFEFLEIISSCYGLNWCIIPCNEILLLRFGRMYKMHAKMFCRKNASKSVEMLKHCESRIIRREKFWIVWKEFKS